LVEFEPPGFGSKSKTKTVENSNQISLDEITLLTVEK